MSIYNQIMEESKEAMLAKESIRLAVLKSIKAAFTNELLAKKKPVKELPDDEALAIIKRLANQRKDSIEQFRAGGRGDLVKAEEAELEILKKYLPATMNKEEIRKIAEKKKSELGVSDKTKTGMLMAAVMKEIKGRAEGAEVKAIIDELLA